MSEGPAPNRRWFRFGLRTLLVVVAVLGAFLGWLTSEWRFVRERRACEARLLRSFKANEGGVAAPYRYSRFANGPDVFPEWPEASARIPSVPIWRRWLGDEPFGIVSVPALWPENEVRDIKALFPEAFVYWRREYLQLYHDKYMQKASGGAKWIRLVEHELGMKIPAGDAQEIQTADDAVRYAQQRRAASRRNLD